MSQTIQKNKIKLTLLLISLGQLSTLAISSVISDISNSFSSVTDQTAQFLMTFPGIFILVTSLLSASLTRFISQKKLAVTGLLLVSLSAVGGFFLHQHILFLFCWSAALGLGLGLWMPIVNAMVSQYFEGAERSTLMGRVSSAQNIGAIFMTVVGGALAVLSWHYVYLVYFIALPGLICAILFLPDEKKAAPEQAASADHEKKKFSFKDLGIDKNVIIFCSLQFFYSLPYNAGPANFSLIVSERGLGNSSVAGILSGLFLCGGILGGLLFGRIERKFRHNTIAIGFLLLGIGFVGLGTIQSLPIVLLSTVIGGMSLPFMLSTASLGVVENKKPEQFAMASACLMAFGNLGTFCSPFTTSLSYVVFGSESISLRMLFCAALALIGAVITILLFTGKNKKH